MPTWDQYGQTSESPTMPLLALLAPWRVSQGAIVSPTWENLPIENMPKAHIGPLMLIPCPFNAHHAHKYLMCMLTGSQAPSSKDFTQANSWAFNILVFHGCRYLSIHNCLKISQCISVQTTPHLQNCFHIHTIVYSITYISLLRAVTFTSNLKFTKMIKMCQLAWPYIVVIQKFSNNFLAHRV